MGSWLELKIITSEFQAIDSFQEWSKVCGRLTGSMVSASFNSAASSINRNKKLDVYEHWMKMYNCLTYIYVCVYLYM